MQTRQKTITGLIALLACLAGLPARPADAAIMFDATRNAIHVTDYPAAAPCTLPQLATADRAFGWNRVRYDQSNTTCYIDCDLIIGANDGTDTFLQVGTPDRTRETLIMHGNIIVHPYWAANDENHAKWWQAPAKINRLTIGRPDDTNVQCVIKFAPSNSLMAGRCLAGKIGRGGQLFVYNGAITALQPEHGFANMLDGREVSLEQAGADGHVLQNARLSNMRGRTCYGMNPGPGKIFEARNTVFSQFGFLAPGAGRYTGCIFEGATDAAIRDFGAINVELVDCILRDNHRNWVLTFSDRGLCLIDCAWDPPRRDNIHRTRINPDGTKTRPRLVVQRHVVVEVTDAAGAPVPDARVSFRAEQAGCDLLRTVFKTDAQGRTTMADDPGRDQAVLLTDYAQTASAVDDQPTITHFSYAFTVEKDGRTATLAGARADASWKVIRLLLE